MNHQLFEEWLLSDDPLAPQELADLREHLETCKSCQTLSLAWQEVESHLKTEPVLAPQTGFAARWQKRLEADHRRLHRRQSLALLVFSLSMAAILLATLVFMALPWLEAPKFLLWTMVYQVLNLFSIAGVAGDFISAFFQTASGNIPIVFWVFLAGFVTELGVLWVVSLRLLTNPRRVTQ